MEAYETYLKCCLSNAYLLMTLTDNHLISRIVHIVKNIRTGKKVIITSKVCNQNQNQNQNNFISETYNVSNIKINLILMGANSWKPI